MNMFTRISNEIGSKPPSKPAWPEKEHIEELVEKAINLDRDAFKELFKYYRFLPLAVRSTHQEIQTLIDDGFRKEAKVSKKISSLAARILGGEDQQSVLAPYISDHETKFNNTRTCLQAFMFIHFANVITTTHISQENDQTIKERLGKKEKTQTDIIRVDTYYDETMKVINPFSVSGHYRNQPVGVGRKETKLIYIDSFMKSGYTRLATKEKIDV